MLAVVDARTGKQHRKEHIAEPATEEARALAETITVKRDRLLASLTLIAGIGLLVALAVALVPLLEWFERRGVPSRLSAGLCVIIFLGASIFAIGSIVVPATDWIALVPHRIGKVRAALQPVLELYQNLDRFITRTASQIQVNQEHARTVRIEDSNTFTSLLATSAPHLLIQLFFALLVIFFFLAGWTAMRKKTIVSRGSFEGALTTARVIQQVVDATSTYLGTITVINIGLRPLTACALWLLGMPS